MGEDFDAAVDFDSAFPGLFQPAFVVAYRILDNVTEAEDAATEALARAELRWRKVRGLPYREAWVMRVACNVAIDKVREGPNNTAAPDTADNAALRSALVAALAQLSRRPREVVALRYVAGLSEAEVATCLGMSANSVKKHMLHATTGLREQLDGDMADVELDAH